MPKKTLLIVDDEALFARSLSDGLCALDPTLRVLTAPNGLMAKETIERETVDLVLTDLRMPVMDGYELLSDLARNRPNVPVIVMTAFADPDISERLRPFGVGEVVEKPVDFNALSERIVTVLEAGSSIASARGQLAGRLRAFSPFELLQLLCNLQKVGTLELNRVDGATARCIVVGGGVVEAECGHLRGRQAVLNFLWWRQGGFLYEAGPELEPEGEIVGVPEVLMDAVRIADEIERHKEFVPARDAALFLPAAAVAPNKPLGTAEVSVLDALRQQPGITAGRLEATLPLAPVTLRLALAHLVQVGLIEAGPESEVEPEQTAPGWWKILMEIFPGGLRILVALCPDEESARVFRAVSSLGETLLVANPSFSYSTDGPSFVRLRPLWGGILSLTFLPIARKHRYLFETFVQSVDAVLMCDERFEREEWSKLIPPGVRLVRLGKNNEALEDQIAEGIHTLQEPAGSSSSAPVN